MSFERPASWLAPYPPTIDYLFLGVAPRRENPAEEPYWQLGEAMRRAGARCRTVGLTLDGVYADPEGPCHRGNDFDEIRVGDFWVGKLEGLLFLPDLSSWLNQECWPDGRKLQELDLRLRLGGLVLHGVRGCDASLCDGIGELVADGRRIVHYLEEDCVLVKKW